MNAILAAAALLASPQPAVSVPEPPPPGRTSLEISHDPLDDSVRAFVVYRAGRARLSVGCNRDEFDGVRVSLSDNGWYAPRTFIGRRPVRVRFDGARAWRGLWKADEGVVSLRGRERVGNFLGWLAQSERLAMRTSDVEDRRREFVFSIGGSRGLIEQMLDACGAAAVRQAIAPAAPAAD